MFPEIKIQPSVMELVEIMDRLLLIAGKLSVTRGEPIYQLVNEITKTIGKKLAS